MSSFDDQKNFFLYLIKKDLIDTTKYSNKFIHITEIYTIDNFIEDIYKIKIIHDKDYIIKEVKKEINIVKKECENNYNYFINELEKINKKEN
ncbi:MAG: hypothetical protein QM532_01585 [Cyanobium sp. MAG06]|nr:hypothetical protein [Cyanobium sp. MAG06]